MKSLVFLNVSYCRFNDLLTWFIYLSGLWRFHLHNHNIPLYLRRIHLEITDAIFSPRTFVPAPASGTSDPFINSYYLVLLFFEMLKKASIMVTRFRTATIKVMPHWSSHFEAKVMTEICRREYNNIRPHSSLGYRPPAPEAIQPIDPTLNPVQ